MQINLKGIDIMTYKQIESAREARMWVKDIIVPAAVAISAVASIPEVREKIKQKSSEINQKIKNRKKKKQPELKLVKNEKGSEEYSEEDELKTLLEICDRTENSDKNFERIFGDIK